MKKTIPRRKSNIIIFLMALVSVMLITGCVATRNQNENQSSCKVENVAGTFPGVLISVGSDKCEYKVGEGGVFNYKVSVDSSAPVIHVPASSGCGACRIYEPDPLSFVWVQIQGIVDNRSIKYCVCDQGCCAPDNIQTITLNTGTSYGTFEWPGRQWNGPSDTNEPLGEVFPPGQYSFVLEFTGFEGGMVTANLPFEVVE